MGNTFLFSPFYFIQQSGQDSNLRLGYFNSNAILQIVLPRGTTPLPDYFIIYKILGFLTSKTQQHLCIPKTREARSVSLRSPSMQSPRLPICPSLRFLQVFRNSYFDCLVVRTGFEPVSKERSDPLNASTIPPPDQVQFLNIEISKEIISSHPITPKNM